MPRVEARFADTRAAQAALEAMDGEGVTARLDAQGDRGHIETRFMGRIVVLVAAWSVVGTALGVGLGALIWAIVGPEGTSGLVIQAVSWAIFAHLMGGMFAGYWLLADRSDAELPIPGAVRLAVECASIDDARAAAVRLRELGAEIDSLEQGGDDGKQV